MISVIIVNYNTYDITAQCIKSIINHTYDIEYEIILVDNASSDRDPDDFLILFPNIHLIKSDTNLGFAKGNNLGIRHASGDIILLLNSDTYFTENTLKKSFDKFCTLPKVGFLGVKMQYPDGRLQYTARRFRSIGWELLDLFRFIPFLLPYESRANLMLGKYFKSDVDLECDWLNGAFLMFNRSVLNELPNQQLDERFFMYGEDHLWCYQVHSIGYINYFFSGTFIVHINNASTEPAKRLRLLKTMFKHELDIMCIRKKKGLYYYLFFMLYGFKDQGRYFFKRFFKR